MGSEKPSTHKVSVPSAHPLQIDDDDNNNGYHFPEMFKAKKIILICTQCCSGNENSVQSIILARTPNISDLMNIRRINQVKCSGIGMACTGPAAPGVGGKVNIEDTEICCGFFRTALHSCDNVAL